MYLEAIVSQDLKPSFQTTRAGVRRDLAGDISNRMLEVYIDSERFFFVARALAFHERVADGVRMTFACNVLPLEARQVVTSQSCYVWQHGRAVFWPD